MNMHFGKKYFGSLMALCVFAGLGFAGTSRATAQEQAGQAGATTPPKVLVIEREFLKPSTSASQHEKTESAFVQTTIQANSGHYLAMDSLTGLSRSLFFFSYDSFGAWEKDNQALHGTPASAQAFDKALQADGELLTSSEGSAFIFRNDLSLNAPVNIADMRYFEIIVYKVRPGHDQDFEDLAKQYIQGYAKIPNQHWATYQEMFGAKSGGKYIVILPMKSLAEVDHGMADDRQFASAMGADGMEGMANVSASSLEATETNLFMFNPKMSYVSDSWKAADPAFWGEK